MAQVNDYVVFTTLRFTRKDIEGLDEDLAALLVATSFQLNEINFFSRQISGTFHLINKGEIAGEFVAIQQNIILRKLTLALFEYLNMFERAEKNAKSRKLPKTHELPVLLRSFKEEFERLKADPAFKTAKRVRNKYAGHLDLMTSRTQSHVARLATNSLHMSTQTKETAITILQRKLLFSGHFHIQGRDRH